MIRLAIVLGSLILFGSTPALAQICPWNGDEPPEFTHFVDLDGDGACDRAGGEFGDFVVAEAESPSGALVHPNGNYPDCDLDDGERQTSHGHWEYVHHQVEPHAPSVTEEKDYLTLPQSLLGDLEAADTGLTRTLDSVGQTVRFAAHEPVRFDRFLGSARPPSGRYWQVDEWIGPALPLPFGPIPLLTWNERFFVCATATDPLGDCFARDGLPVLGAYWSDHQSGFNVPDCGDGTDPAAGRDPRCGFLFTAAPSCPVE